MLPLAIKRNPNFPQMEFGGGGMGKFFTAPFRVVNLQVKAKG